MKYITIEEIRNILKEKRNIIEIDFVNIELKSSWKQEDGKKISGIANRGNNDSSFLIIGINDHGNVLNNDKTWATQTEEILSNHFNQYLDPVQTCKNIFCEEYQPGNYVIIVEFHSPNMLVLWNKKPYKMSGTTCLEMSPEEAMEYTLKYPSKNDFTSQDNEAILNKELITKYFERIISKYPTPAFQILLEKNHDEGLLHLHMLNKQVARLLFGDAKYRIVIFNTDGSIIHQDTKTNLITILNDNLWEEIVKWYKDKYDLDADNIYPKKAINECFANAVAHAAYFRDDGDIIIEIHKDKIIVSNLCLPESGYFANKWFSRSHNTINKLLMESLRISKYVDELGRGKYLIYSEFLKASKHPPEVYIESAGRLNRWKTFLYGNIFEENYKHAFEALKERYGNTEKAQIAFSLVLWRGKSVEEIKRYIDGDSAKKYSEIINDFRGPIFYYEKNNQFILNRWMRLIIEEGIESKTLSSSEEDNLYKFAYNMATKYENAIITPKKIREYGDLGKSNSAKTQSSMLIAKWKKEGKVIPCDKSGEYKFVQIEIKKQDNSLQQLLNTLINTPKTTEQKEGS